MKTVFSSLKEINQSCCSLALTQGHIFIDGYFIIQQSVLGLHIEDVQLLGLTGATLFSDP